MPPNSGARLAPLRDIVEEDSYQEQLKGLHIQYADIDVAFENVGMTLARRPEIFPQVLDTGVHRLRINGYGKFPDLDVWFTFKPRQGNLWVNRGDQQAPFDLRNRWSFLQVESKERCCCSSDSMA